MLKIGNPKTSKPHKIPIGSRVFITENFTDPYHIQVRGTQNDYSGRMKKKRNNSEDAIMLSDQFRYGK